MFLDILLEIQVTAYSVLFAKPKTRPYYWRWRVHRRTILPNSRLTGQFCFLGVRLTGQVENLDRLTVLVM